MSGLIICQISLPCSAAEKVYGNHLALHKINRAEDLTDIIIVDFESEVIGAHNGMYSSLPYTLRTLLWRHPILL